MELTKVIFRKYKDGDIIAIFPEELGSMDIFTCSSYMHIGQHSACNPIYIIRGTELAMPEEYKDLKEELENYGPENAHYHLKVYKRYTYQMFLNRQKYYKEFMGQ